MMSNVSTLSDGGIFKKPEEKKILPDAKTKIIGPDMSKLREMKNKRRRTEEYLKLLHQKRKVSLAFKIVYFFGKSRNSRIPWYILSKK